MRQSYATPDQMREWAARQMLRNPDVVIGDDPNRPYLKRWWILPRNDQINLYLHLILRSDDDRAMHDHPWDNTSWIIDGSYIEHTPEGVYHRDTGYRGGRLATDRHRLEIVNEPAVTLFFTGPKVREWGFWCEGERFVHWEDFIADLPGGIVGTGRGCGEH
jgi:hypothetical protein